METTVETLQEQINQIAATIETALKEKGLKADQNAAPDEIKRIEGENRVMIEKMVADQLRLVNEQNIEAQRQKRAAQFDLKAPKISDLSLGFLDDNKFDPRKSTDPRVKVYCLDQKQLLFHHTAEEVAAIQSFKTHQDAVYLAGLVAAFRNKTDYFSAVRQTGAYKEFTARLKSDSQLRKALDTLTASEGLEWIPTGFSSNLLEAIRLEFKVAAQFETFTMPTNPYRYPVEGADFEAYYQTQATADSATKITAATPGTANVEFSAIKLAARVLFSEEVNEDSIIGMQSFVQNKLAVAIASSFENAILNGDDSGTHQDTDTAAGAATLAAKAFKGHRYWALNNAGTAGLDFSNAVPTIALLRSTRALMGKFGIDPKNLFWTVGVETYYNCLQIAEFLTMDKIGANATVVTGMLGAIDAAPLLVSEKVREDTNASGVNDGVTTDRAVIHLTDRRGFMTGERSGVTVQAIRDIETDQMILVGKYRVDHEDVYDATTAANIQTVVGYNVDK